MKKLPRFIIQEPETTGVLKMRMRESVFYLRTWVDLKNYSCENVGIVLGKKVKIAGGFFVNISYKNPLILITKQKNLWKTSRLIFHEFSHYLNWLLFKKIAPGWSRTLDRLIDNYLK